MLKSTIGVGAIYNVKHCHTATTRNGWFIDLVIMTHHNTSVLSCGAIKLSTCDKDVSGRVL